MRFDAICNEVASQPQCRFQLFNQEWGGSRKEKTPSTGAVTPEFKAALAQHGLKAFMKDDASAQPGKLGDMMLHETCVAWIRKLETKTQPRKPWEETREAYFERLKGIVAKINSQYEVEELNRELPERLVLLDKKKGGKLKK